jgi:predicted dehydrogenase
LLVYTKHVVDDIKADEWTTFSFADELVRRTYVTYFERFAEAVLDGGPLDIPGEEGRKDLEVLLAAYKAGETEQPVELPIEVNHDKA